MELTAIIVAAWVMIILVGDTPECERDPILMRGGKIAAVSWVDRGGAAREPRAGMVMRPLGRLEVVGGWCLTA